MISYEILSQRLFVLNGQLFYLFRDSLSGVMPVNQLVRFLVIHWAFRRGSFLTSECFLCCHRRDHWRSQHLPEDRVDDGARLAACRILSTAIMMVGKEPSLKEMIYWFRRAW